MELKLLDHAEQIREAFIAHFVLSWEAFKSKHPMDEEWCKRAFLWDRMDSAKSPDISFDAALTYLRTRNGPVLFMFEAGKSTHYKGNPLVDFVAEADAQVLATQIEQEWYTSFRLAAQYMYDPNAFFPEDVYVFDLSMSWCVVFTHETTDWEAEQNDEWEKVAQSRLCILCEESSSGESKESEPFYRTLFR